MRVKTHMQNKMPLSKIPAANHFSTVTEN